ncbi:MAG: lactoylglutathione lyase [Gammaproteobacteria bacterium]|nr:lactoylglutathione lyase [Gammaproteobacteria bacterium]
MRLMHTMLRVTDLDRSIEFYCDVLGMQLIAQQAFPGGRFTIAFLGYGDNDNMVDTNPLRRTDPMLELTHNWDTSRYEMGNAYGHIAIEVEDAYAACERISARGGQVTRPAGPMKHGTTVIAFAADPDGYSIELIQP